MGVVLNNPNLVSFFAGLAHQNSSEWAVATRPSQAKRKRPRLRRFCDGRTRQLFAQSCTQAVVQAGRHQDCRNGWWLILSQIQ
eukprot:4120852-Amphidinium_carterae.2